MRLSQLKPLAVAALLLAIACHSGASSSTLPPIKVFYEAGLWNMSVGKTVISNNKIGHHGDLTCCDLCIDIKAHLDKISTLERQYNSTHDMDDYAAYISEVVDCLDAENEFAERCHGSDADCCARCAEEHKVMSGCQ